MEDERLAGLAAALRAAARDALARLAAEPWLHAKRALAEHAEEDTLTAAAIEALLDRALHAADAAPPPARIAAEARALAATTDDPGRLGLLLGLAAAQERHADELPAPGWRPAAEAPARDPFVLREPGAAPDPIDDAISAAERAAAAGDAGRAADHMRTAAELDRRRTEAGDPWGTRPIPEA
jgi:hypothetical protein